ASVCDEREQILEEAYSVASSNEATHSLSSSEVRQLPEYRSGDSARKNLARRHHRCPHQLGARHFLVAWRFSTHLSFFVDGHRRDGLFFEKGPRSSRCQARSENTARCRDPRRSCQPRRKPTPLLNQRQGYAVF